MAELIETAAVDGLPVTIGAATLELCPMAQAVWLGVLPGQGAAVSEGLRASLGLGFPAPDRVETGKSARAVWVGPGEAIVFGPVPRIAGAVVTDYTDAIACLRLSGRDAREVLMRLAPLDIRDAAFPVGASARTHLGHMTASILRTGDDSFEVIVMRSMTRTAVHDLTRAMTGLRGQAGVR